MVRDRIDFGEFPRVDSLTSSDDRSLEASRTFTEYLEPIVKARRANPGEDLLSSLVTVEVDGESLSDEEVCTFIRVLFPAGADTTYRGLGNMLFAVLTHPLPMLPMRHRIRAVA